jgi:hypothetical protein
MRTAAASVGLWPYPLSDGSGSNPRSVAKELSEMGVLDPGEVPQQPADGIAALVGLPAELSGVQALDRRVDEITNAIDSVGEKLGRFHVAIRSLVGPRPCLDPTIAPPRQPVGGYQGHPAGIEPSMTITVQPTQDFSDFSEDMVALKAEVVEGDARREVWLAATGVELDTSLGEGKRYDPGVWADLARRLTEELNLQQGHIRDMSVLTVVDAETGSALLPVGHLLRADS